MTKRLTIGMAKDTTSAIGFHINIRKGGAMYGAAREIGDPRHRCEV